jgi:DNA polymerase III epsilon subunit family exonuclease
MFAYAPCVQLTLDAADRLVELLTVRRGPVAAGDAARALYALSSAPVAVARALLEDVVRDDARLAWHGDRVALTGLTRPAEALEHATYVVFDLETTGLTPRTARICEIGAQRIVALEPSDTFETFVNPGSSLPPAVSALTGIREAWLRDAPSAPRAVRRFLAFAGDGVLVAHNARFDLAFLEREVERLTGMRVAAPVVDTVWLARRLLGARVRRVGLTSLAHFFGTAAEPCHRALPDAQATAEVLLHLIGLAQERGARNVSDLLELAAPRARKLHAKRTLVAGAPARPGVYLFRDRHDQVLYVGRARNLRARLRSYLAGERQRSAVEAALGALARIEWRELGSELEAALEELRLLRELRPPANARGTRPDRHVYLARRPDGRWRVGTTPTHYGPLRSKRRAERAVQVLNRTEAVEPALALPALKERLRRLAHQQRFEDAARLRDRIVALEDVVGTLAELERLRRLRVCLVVPAREPGFERAFFVAGGRVAAVRSVPRGAGARLELEAGLVQAAAGAPSLEPADADELLLVGSFLRKPPPELRVVELDSENALAA